MSDTLSLLAEVRKSTGKGSAREVRRRGKLPAVLYGGDTPPEHLAVDRIEIVKAYHRGLLASHLIELKIDGRPNMAIPRDIQIHPLKDDPVHVDFLRVTRGTRVTVSVPVQFENDERSPGIKRGGVLNIVRHEVELECPATEIPEYLTVDLSAAAIGDAIKISNITLPDSATPTITDRDFTIATIAAPSGLKSETEEEEGEDADGTPAKPAGAADAD